MIHFLHRFRRMVNGNQDVNTLLMGVIQPLQYLPEWNCGGKCVKVDYRKINNGMIYQKNWAFRKLFDYQLLRLKEDGEIDRIKKNYFGKEEKKVLLALGLFCSIEKRTIKKSPKILSIFKPKVYIPNKTSPHKKKKKKLLPLS